SGSETHRVRGLCGGSRSRSTHPTTLFPLGIVEARTRISAAPIEWVDALLHIAMERRPGIISDSLNQSMFDWIPVDVIDAAIQIILVPAGVFPEAPLPHCPFAMTKTRGRGSPFLAARFEIGAGEGFLDLPPTRGIIGIAFRERPDAVE